MKKYLFAISFLALAVNANASEVCTAVSLPMVKDAR